MAQQLLPYKLQPPKNLSALHKTSVELGYPDFYPPKPGQDEDLMTEENVQKGFTGALFVELKLESFSAQDMMLDEIRDPKGLENLGEFMTDIMKRKHEINTFEESSPYTVPQIVWVTVETRDEWLRRLAGNSPLKELAENVPRVVEGTQLLELVTHHRVPLARATWFTKIVGINLINSRTTHQETSHNATQEYTKNWNQTFHTFIKNQSREYDPDKWRYSILLAKWQFDDGLLDQRILRLTLDNLDQADHLNTVIWLWFVQQFLEEFQRSRTLMRLLIEIILKKLQDIYQHPAIIPKLDIVVKMLKNMLHTLFLATPDMFVFPVCWNTYKDLLRCVFVEDSSIKTDTVIPKNMKRQMERYYELIRARNEVFDKEKPDMIGKRNAQELQQSRIIQILDKIGFHADYQSIAAEYFRTNSKFPMLEREASTHINWLCYWAVTKHRAGDYRVYSVSTILDIWKNSMTKAEEKLQRQTTIQNSLMDFLDIYPLGCNGICEDDECNIVAGLFGELIRNGHFSHQRYLQRLVARGDMLHERRETDRSKRHLKYVKCFPLFNTELHHLNQRRVILYNVNCDDISDEKEYESMVMMIKDKLPYLFSRTENELDSPTVDHPVSDMHLALNFNRETTEFMRNATKFCQIKVIQTWLLPQVKSFVQNTPIGPHNWRNPTQPGSSLLNARQFSTIVKVIELAKDYNSLLDLLLWVLENSTEKCLFQSIIDTLKRHEIVWDAMGKSEQVLDALMKKSDQLRDKRQTEICIVKYLINSTHDSVNAKRGKLEQDLQSQIKSQLSQAVSNHYSRFEEYNSMKPFLSRVRASNNDSRLFQSDVDAVYKMVESYINIIIQYSHNYADENFTEGRIVIGIFGDLFRDICDRMADGLDLVFEKWIKSLSRTDEDNIFGNENTLLLIFFMMLVVRHLVCMKIIIEHLCDKNLKRLVEKLSNQKQMDPKEAVECKNLVNLLRLLLLQDGDNPSIQLPLSTTEIQVLTSHCEALSHNNDFVIIVSNIFQRLAIIECLTDSKGQLIDALIQLRVDFSRIEWFRQLCIINNESVYNRFVKGKRLSNNKEIEKRIINIVQTAFGDGVDILDVTKSSVYIKYLKNIFSQISLWNIKKSRIEFWLCMDQIMLIDSVIPRSSSLPTIKDEDDKIANFGEFPKNESLKNAVIDWFWEELILKGEIDCGFLSNVIKGIREDVSIELFEKGLCILKRCTELISGIEEIFRSLLRPLNVDKKINFCDALLSQIKKIQDDIPHDDTVYVSSIISRVKLLVLGAHVLTNRVTEVVTQTNQGIVRQISEYTLIEKLFVTLVNLLCDSRIHQNGGGFAHFDLILDLVSFLLDDGEKCACYYCCRIKAKIQI
ncbi:hypothetical protein C2G38_341878 [Gigaspora rosea]|uniref:Mediator of RNA polymerase II transcription subunit 12 n=1 Tax=Gigaspora rosea TaxID=44941 RepID=A0A397UEE1_9GLOM|nr:hypothetical protein C2G38_341878 [Gigaspora rosea]